ncbi:DNA-binding transcriptional regulator, AcrR family [Lentzea waywayandensis]|uniref:DNA-binding transcriptional regulator, AcrR family n=1 Tax=Lentzea waywayandensis TaxID=84724 RepID=A0A1I6DF67_9PSEU|nr:TetR/AcrR family transcriptional regulator [Lentzea waywayandensis]SFR04130.1 DNA-binding transcriptional regulator, AcrR family [Lentzea waywayandensis]
MTGLSSRVRTALRAVTLSQRELAVRIGMDPTALSKALRGTRRLRDEEITAIAEACSVTVAYLTRGTGPEPVVADRVRERAEVVTAQERRDQILAAATVLIARRGYHNVRVSDIARHCGTSTATVHYHFPTKEAALHAAMEHYARSFRARVEREFGQATSARDKLRRLIDVQLPLATDDVDEWSVWVQFWSQAMFEPRLRPVQRLVYSDWRRIVVDLLGECRAEGLCAGADVEALADRFIAMADGLAVQILASSTEMRSDRMRELLLRAFEPDLVLTA